jgi:hAT family C-terminal dimerisation region
VQRAQHFQDNGHLYLTFRQAALDFLPCQASSIACECLFSAGGEIATKRRVQLGSDRFEELQIMKSAWKKDIEDFASWNSGEVEEVDDSMREYEDWLTADQEWGQWDDAEAEIISHN